MLVSPTENRKPLLLQPYKRYLFYDPQTLSSELSVSRWNLTLLPLFILLSVNNCVNLVYKLSFFIQGPSILS